MDRRDLLFTAAAALASGMGASVSAQVGPTSMHPPKYKAVQDAAAACVTTGEDCLRHCLGMSAMKDTSMAACEMATLASSARPSAARWHDRDGLVDESLSDDPRRTLLPHAHAQ
jgi:hypothetical protein